MATNLLQPLDKWGRPISSHRNIFTDIDNGKIADDQNQYWDWLFGLFYHKNPEFDDSNLATTLSGCMGLVDVAESIHAVDNVRPIVDLALLRQNQVLWSSIASNPVAWAELGRRVHSPTIFREGVIHIVGKWHNISEKDKRDLHPTIHALCERKYDDIELAKEAIEMRILGHYPDFLCRNAVDRPGRPSYSNDIYMWMAICFFRQWFAQAISDGRNRTSADGGFEFYNQIGQGGQAYLGHESFKNFHQYFPMSSKACNVLEANMNVLKEDVKKFVGDLLCNRTNVSRPSFELQWLTCAVIGKEDEPWSVIEPDDQPAMDDQMMEEELRPLTPIPLRPSGKKKLFQGSRRSNESNDTTGIRGCDTANVDDEEQLPGESHLQVLDAIELTSTRYLRVLRIKVIDH